ncbi:MAG: hypothetical protein ACLP22_07740, partial [Solirubrobacteraceae bacterium]
LRWRAPNSAGWVELRVVLLRHGRVVKVLTTGWVRVTAPSLTVDAPRVATTVGSVVPVIVPAPVTQVTSLDLPANLPSGITAYLTGTAPTISAAMSAAPGAHAVKTHRRGLHLGRLRPADHDRRAAHHRPLGRGRVWQAHQFH